MSLWDKLPQEIIDKIYEFRTVCDYCRTPLRFPFHSFTIRRFGGDYHTTINYCAGACLVESVSLPRITRIELLGYQITPRPRFGRKRCGRVFHS